MGAKIEAAGLPDSGTGHCDWRDCPDSLHRPAAAEECAGGPEG